MRIQLPGRLLHGSSRGRRVSQKRQSHGVSTSAQIQRLDSRVLLSAVTGGTGTFVDSGQDLGEYNGVALGDLDQDGDTDAFVFDPFLRFSRVASVAVNDGTGNFAAGDQFAVDTLGGVASAALGDVDGDGDLDAIPILGSADGRVLINDGFGGFQDSGQSLENGTRHVGLGDLDGDGDVDALIAQDYDSRGTTQAWLNDGTGVFQPGEILPNSSGGHGIELADFDSDGDLDALIGASGNRHHIWINDGDAGFADSGAVGPAYSKAVVGDVDGDLEPDILFTDSQHQTEVWLNNGNGTFSDSGNRLGAGPETQIALGDVDGDEDLDVVLGNGNGPNTVWLNNGTGNFSATGQELGAEGTRNIALGDFDGDGDLDLFETGRQGGTTRVWLNQDQPVTDQVDLPDGGGTFEVLVDNGDLVVREQGGDELFRQAQADVPRLQINGSDADDTLVVDFSGGNPIPGSRLEFFAGGQSSGDALILVSGSVTSVSHSFTSDTSGSVIVDGAMLLYSGVEPTITDGLTADRRYFTYGDASDDVSLEDNGTDSDGISRIANATTGRTLDFINPSDRLVVSSGAGSDIVTLNAPDALFSGTVSVNGQDGNDLLRMGTQAGSVRLTGGTGDDMLFGGMQDDTLDGGAGNDVLNGRGGDDQLYGGTGDDFLLGGSGPDLLIGGDGSDRLSGQGGSGDTLTGGGGDDILDGGAGRDWLVESADYMTILTDSTLQNGQQEDEAHDQIIDVELAKLTDMRQFLTVGAFIDASGFSGRVALYGSPRDDTLIGSSQDDTLDGGGGDDSLDGGGGHDTLTAGDGNDSLLGGDGNDRLDAGDGDDTLIGGSGDDSLDGGWGNDAIAGQAGNDWLNGRRDDDTLLGGDGNDTLLGGGQNDILLGEDGVDLIRGHSGEDTVTGAGMGSTASPDDTVMGGTIDDAFTVDTEWLSV